MTELLLRKQLTNSSTSNCPKRIKSPYALQYLQFEKRLEGKKVKARLPSLSIKSKKQGVQAMKGDEYLQFANLLKKNKEMIVFGQQKQNLYPVFQPTMQQMTIMKNKIGKLKSRHSYQCHNQNIQQTPMFIRHSQQLKDHPILGEISQNNRSRVSSQATSIRGRQNRQNEKEDIIKFITYKKSKRQLSVHLKQRIPLHETTNE